MTRKTKPRRTGDQPDIYTRITNEIVSSLERGVKPWTQPWQASHAAGPVTRPLRFNGEYYSGINVIILWAGAMERGFAAPIWMTFRQAKELGAHVRKGEKGAPVVYADTLLREAEDEHSGETVTQAIPFMKGYTVFNVEQIEGLPDHYYARAETQTNPDERIAEADRFFAATGARIEHGGNSACYSITHDRVRMPDFEAFRSAERYFAVLAHELTHWTRHPSRLDRDFGRKRFGDEAYAREELVAELGAAFLCADLGLTLEDRDDHAAYIGSWLQVLKNDSRAIFAAAAYAQNAADFIKSCDNTEIKEAAA